MAALETSLSEMGAALAPIFFNDTLAALIGEHLRT